MSEAETKTGSEKKDDQLKLISYNIQAGTSTTNYRQYLTKGWQHLLPSRNRLENLDQLSGALKSYDMAGLQEADAGSLRSGYLDQTRYLAERAGFDYWISQSNRKVGNLAHVCNGLLTRSEPIAFEDHKLPGRFPGRGALIAHFGFGNGKLTIAVIHLSLGKNSRRAQFDYLSEVLSEHKNLIVMGDANCSFTSGEMDNFLAKTGLCEPADMLCTFPSWQPDRAIDHILVSPNIEVLDYSVIDLSLSDHLPVAMEVRLPPECLFQPKGNQKENVA